jgi:hypothetical protein
MLRRLAVSANGGCAGAEQSIRGTSFVRFYGEGNDQI